MSSDDWWGPGLASPKFKFPDTAGNVSEYYAERIERMEKLAARIGIEPEFRMAAIERVLHPPTGTIHCSSVNEKGEMSGATTTSGLATPRSSAPEVIPIRMSVRQERQVTARRTSKSWVRTPSWRTCGAVCHLRKPAWML
jgi:hypothetical protein